MFVFLFLGLHLLILSQFQFTAWPEMVSFPYLINHGFVIYRDMAHAYPPFLVSVLAVLYKIFGYKILVLQIFGWGFILTSDILIFLIVKKLTRKLNFALYSLIFYVFAQPILEGNMVWPDLAMVPFLLLTFLLLSRRKYLFAGIAVGLACLTKQTGSLYVVLGVLYIVYSEKNLRSVVAFLAPSIVMFVLLLFRLLTNGALEDFLNWVIIYPSRYWTKFPGYVQLNLSLRENLNLLVLFLPLSYLIFSAKRKIFVDKYFLLLFIFLICGVIGVYPRFSFFHFQPALAFLVILCVYLFSKTKLKIYFLFLIPIFVLIVNFKSLELKGNRFWESSDLVLAKTIQNETPSGKPIYLLGLNSSLYAFSDRLPNKPWLDNFGWYLEIPGVQEKVIKGFEKNPPSVIFWLRPEGGNWYDIGTYQPKRISDWIEKNYNMKKEIQKGVWEWVKK